MSVTIPFSVCHFHHYHVTVYVTTLVAFQLESTDGVTVIVYATTTAPLLAQLPADSGGCGFIMCAWLVCCSFIRGHVSVHGSTSYGTSCEMV